MTIHTQFEVSLVPDGLTSEESVVQIADTLDFVNQLASDVFERIRNRIDECQKKIQNINNRADVAHKKVNKLVGSKKAVTVFSTSKYPIVNLSSESDVLVPARFQPVQIKRSNLSTSDYERKEKGRIFQVPFQKPQYSVPLASTHSVGGLLVFETMESIHESSSSSPPMEQSRTTLADAPHSILEREGLERPSALSYLYTPHLGDVPQLDLPLDLPDLPGIATDIIYESDLGPGIAPSLGFNPNIHQAILEALPELPDLHTIDSSDRPVPPPPMPSASCVPVPPFVPLPPPSVTYLPPPPLPPPMLPLVQNVAPPPPPQLPRSSAVDEADKREVVSGVPDRSNLMDAIRKAGGAQALKKPKAEKSKVEKKAAPAAPAGDLMADLFNKLSMRRKGISGSAAGQIDAKATVSAMNRVNSLIPPPPKPTVPVSPEEEEDWQ